MAINYCPTHHRFHDMDDEPQCPDCDSDPAPTSILSKQPDGMGFYHGHAPGEFRQINVQQHPDCWSVHVGGEFVGLAKTKAQAETKALLWCSTNPEAL